MIIGFDNSRKCPVVLAQFPYETFIIGCVTQKFKQKKFNLEMLQELMKWYHEYQTDRPAYEKRVAERMNPKKD